MEQTFINCKTASISELKRAFFNHQPIAGIEQRASHYGPHNDELCAMFIIAETPEGRHLFPGIEDSSIGYLTPTMLRMGDYEGIHGFFKAMKLGILLFGVGGGCFDEHGDRDNDQSCVNLVKNHIDLFRSPYNRKVYGGLIRYANYEDNNGDNIIQALNRENPEYKLTSNEIEVVTILQTGMFAQNLKKGFESANTDFEYQQVILGAFQFYRNETHQAKLFIDGERAYGDLSKEQIPFCLDGEEMQLLVIKSDHPVMNKVVHSRWRSNRKEKLGVLFIHKSNGQFVIIPNRSIAKEKMVEVVKILRQKVVLNDSDNLPPIAFRDLDDREILNDVPEIHFSQLTGTISNGSKVDADVPGLINNALNIQDVIDAIIIGLENQCFPKKFIENCKKGICAKGVCPFYNFGLERCHNIRNQKIAINDQQTHCA